MAPPTASGAARLHASFSLDINDISTAIQSTLTQFSLAQHLSLAVFGRSVRSQLPALRGGQDSFSSAYSANCSYLAERPRRVPTGQNTTWSSDD
jgi:hypothetical protein